VAEGNECRSRKNGRLSSHWCAGGENQARIDNSIAGQWKWGGKGATMVKQQTASKWTYFFLQWGGYEGQKDELQNGVEQEKER